MSLSIEEANCFKLTVVFAVLWSTLVLASSSPARTADDDAGVEETFKRYMKTYNKPYQVGSHEYEQRLEIFKASLSRIQQFNTASASERNTSASFGSKNNPHPAVFAVNQFSDMSPQEFREDRQCVHKMNKSGGAVQTISSDDLEQLRQAVADGTVPAKWDWRDQNVVTSIKNQQSCGSCWAFAAIEALESRWAIENQHLYSLSVQQLISCDMTTGNSGCSGGRYETAFDWLLDGNKHVDLDSEYPYEDSKGATLPCREIKTASPVQVQSYKKVVVTTANEGSLLSAALYKNGPLAIVVDAVSWQDYSGGIVQHHCSEETLDHAVVIVGYDMTGPVPYWIVRNTWGEGWGISGYIYIEVGKGLCGLDNSPTYVTVPLA